MGIHHSLIVGSLVFIFGVAPPITSPWVKWFFIGRPHARSWAYTCEGAMFRRDIRLGDGEGHNSRYFDYDDELENANEKS